jgi:hypothetical protein
MLTHVLASSQGSVPLWAWVFLVLTMLALVVLVSVGMQRARGARDGGKGRRGLSPEQQAFQEEMRLMLETRLQERRDRDPTGIPPAAEPRGDPPVG